MEETYKKLFKEFLEGALDEEKKGRYNSAISNYYKALSTLCSLLIYRKKQKNSKVSSRSRFIHEPPISRHKEIS
ncbi:hypothetical protein GF343_04715 [Candidatus Woesearchaeota archaeon]|nr:hypothetical protein [Candidatus Woesearchaeota archaeon]